MKITVCGDVSPVCSNELFIKKDIETLFHDVPTVFAGSDRVLVNLETALTEKDTPIHKPVQANLDGIELAKGAVKEEIMDTLKRQSEALHNGKWLEGWKKFCAGKKEQYFGVIQAAYNENAVEEDNEMFRHYLYTEAHRDVLEEICKLSWETRQEP